MLANRPEPDERQPPRLADWTPEREALAELADRVVEVFVATVRAAGGKAEPSYSPRPVTALSRVRERKRKEKHDALVDRIVPK